MQIALWTVVFVVSLSVLVWSADAFTDAAERIGLGLGVPAFIVGTTIVTLGTTLPELASSLIAVAGGAVALPVGTAAGSNVTNIFLVLGVTALFAERLRAAREIVRVDLPLVIGAAVFAALICFDGRVARVEAALSVLGALLYFGYALAEGRRSRRARQAERETLEEAERKPIDRRVWFSLGVSAAFVYLGARYTVQSVLRLSDLLSIAPTVIAVSAVALGTSLPELVVGITAARRGRLELAIGNVLGATVLNSFAVIGLSGLVRPLEVAPQVRSVALPFMLAAAVLYFFVAQDREIGRWEGGLLVLFYALYLVTLFG